ncbi:MULTISPECIES: MoxR family ATPase [Halorussus]|uniref:AAA family ATPase n=1 Tax=Halorussus TaxID=1070314 RepID=UPI000E219571|nr:MULTISPECIES: MoxR family ATPase [Halorussus]NHN61435.1 MoxR family ATPase [Halorussus sp. JP-T4]
MSDPAALYEDLREEIQTVLVGNEEAVEGLAVALLTKGHVLMEGVPGVAKTTIATSFARATGLDSNRIQMTPDILPADVTGTHVYRESTGEFELKRGPVFANVVVADEINRATAKTQSALLEAMQERTVSIGGQTLSLPEPFLVVATQNPIEMQGTYDLPIAQYDRFQLKIDVEIPDQDAQRALLDRFDDEPDLSPDDVSQVVDRGELLDAREVVADVYVDSSIKQYLLDVAAETRESADTDHGASPRATLSFLDATKARAAIRGRDYVTPDDVKALAEPILSHRLSLSADAELSDVTSDEVVADVLASVDVPEVSNESTVPEEATGFGDDAERGQS